MRKRIDCQRLYEGADMQRAPTKSLTGYLADRTPRRAFYLSGLIMQGGGTLLFGLAINQRALVASQLWQGLSASMGYIEGFASLMDTVPREENWRLDGVRHVVPESGAFDFAFPWRFESMVSCDTGQCF